MHAIWNIVVVRGSTYEIHSQGFEGAFIFDVNMEYVTGAHYTTKLCRAVAPPCLCRMCFRGVPRHDSVCGDPFVARSGAILLALGATYICQCRHNRSAASRVALGKSHTPPQCGAGRHHIYTEMMDRDESNYPSICLSLLSENFKLLSSRWCVPTPHHPDVTPETRGPGAARRCSYAALSCP